MQMIFKGNIHFDHIKALLLVFLPEIHKPHLGNMSVNYCKDLNILLDSRLVNSSWSIQEGSVLHGVHELGDDHQYYEYEKKIYAVFWE